MTANQFNALCESRTIDPSLALENDDIVEALKARDDEAVVTILDNQF
jgi:DNA-binding GntR family transcriptional regulator